MPATEMTTADGPRVYQRLAKVIGDAHWQSVVDRQQAAIQSNFFLDSHLRSEYAIAYQLESLRRQVTRSGEVPHSACNNPNIFPALAFAAQVLEVLDHSRPKQANTFIRRVRTAFSSAENMRGMRLELQAATHFVRRGHRVAWHRQKNGGFFDLLVEDLGSNGLEVECKSISEDKGRRIHRRDALDFWGEVWKHTAGIAQNLSSGLAVVLTVPNRLPRGAEERVLLAKEVAVQIQAGSDVTLSGGESIGVRTFDPATLIAAMRMGREEWRKAIDDVTGTANRGAALYPTPAGGMLAFVVQSAVEDDVLRQIFATLDDSAARQFTSERGALFWVMLEGIDAAELKSLHQMEDIPGEQPTPLRLGVSNFLHHAPDHIVGVVFGSKTSLSPAVGGTTDYGGSSYFFLKEDSPFWHPSFRNPLTAIGTAD